MRALLMNPPTVGVANITEIGEAFPRIGIASIAGFVESKGIEVRVLDPVAEKYSLKDSLKWIRKYQPDVVGIGAFTQEIINAAKTAKEIKNYDKDIKIVVGGPHASALPLETLNEFESIDITVHGEGELTFYEILNALERNESLKDVDGIAFRHRGKIVLNKPRKRLDLNKLPLPSWNLFNLDKYKGHVVALHTKKSLFSKELELPIETARGCPFRCTFCYKFVKGIKFKSPKKAVDEMEINIREYGSTKLHFVEGTFGINKRHAIKICDEIIKRGLHKEVSWSAGIKADIIYEELLKKMKRAGCVNVGIGAESGDQGILDFSKKGTTLRQVKQAAELCKKIGINTIASFIIGHPLETKESIEKTIEFSKTLDVNAVSFPIMVPFPGTKIYEMAKKGEGNYIFSAKNWYDFGTQTGNALRFKNLSRKVIKRFQLKAYLSFYLRSEWKMFYLLGLMLGSSKSTIFRTLKDVM